MRFSQRMGLTPIKTVVQLESMDDALRNSLWNMLTIFVWDTHRDSHYYGETKNSSLYPLLASIWHNFFKQPLDAMPDTFVSCIDVIRQRFFKWEWSTVYDFIEFIVNEPGLDQQEAFVSACNRTLEREVSGYRFIGTLISPISSEQELQSVEEALSNTSPFSGANVHLKAALDMLADRSAPDYRNSIKESISAVESVAQAITGDASATLGSALKEIERNGTMHSALKASFSSLYGYTSDADGIRHAMLDASSLSFADAKFMLVACSAFVNYLIAKDQGTAQ